MAHFFAIWGANFFETFCDTFILPKTDEIGAIEGISHQNISKSIGSALKKIKKLFP